MNLNQDAFGEKLLAAVLHRLTVAISALQLTWRLGAVDIARLLLARGATVEHVDAGGCTALTMLWFDMTIPFSRAEFARTLHAASPLSVNSEAEELFKPLACVAISGSAEDVKLMLGLGSKIPESDATSNCIMNCCVQGSNPESYDCLVQHMSFQWRSPGGQSRPEQASSRFKNTRSPHEGHRKASSDGRCRCPRS